jgi:hypothetical protein
MKPSSSTPLRRAEQRVISAALRMVAPKGYGFFGTHLGEGLCSVAKMQQLEAACAALKKARKP